MGINAEGKQLAGGVSGLGAWQTVVAVAMWLLTSLTMCLCGHMDEWSLLFTVSSTGLAWWGFFCSYQGWGKRAAVLGMVVLTTVTLGKNIADVVWFGHHPLL